MLRLPVKGPCGHKSFDKRFDLDDEARMLVRWNKMIPQKASASFSSSGQLIFLPSAAWRRGEAVPS